MSNAPASTKAQFQAYYLQRATAELAEDLDTLRTADDFSMAKAAQTNTAATTPGNSTGKHGSAEGTASAPAAAPVFDSPLQMLIEALRQGADMFGEEDQKRVMAAGEERRN